MLLHHLCWTRHWKPKGLPYSLRRLSYFFSEANWGTYPTLSQACGFLGYDGENLEESIPMLVNHACIKVAVSGLFLSCFWFGLEVLCIICIKYQCLRQPSTIANINSVIYDYESSPMCSSRPYYSSSLQHICVIPLEGGSPPQTRLSIGGSSPAPPWHRDR